MAEETTAGTAAAGASDPGPAAPATQDGPAPDAGGQPAEAGQGAPPAEESFFDPRDLEGKPELQSAYKGMQKAFTKRMQELATHRQKIAAYDQFATDPAGTLQKLASQYGYRLSRADAQAMAQGQQPQADPQGWEPKNWDEVIERAEQSAEKKLMQKLQPLFGELQNVKKTSIERELSEIDPAWQQYEDSMRDNLGRHPSLAADPAMLYRMSVPPEVIESRAVQKALKRMETKTKSSQVASSSQTTKKPGVGMPDESVPFAKAVEIARAKLAEQGLLPPR